jgi:hypothetical protein
MSISKRMLLWRLLILKTEVDYNGRCETPVGIAGRLRPRRLAEEAQLTPHGKGASWSCNQLTHSIIATMYTKTAKVFTEKEMNSNDRYYECTFTLNLTLKVRDIL